jgi:hypothetical protein
MRTPDFGMLNLTKAQQLMRFHQLTVVADVDQLYERRPSSRSKLMSK